MNEGCFQSASLCGNNPYIGDLYLQKFLVLLYILWNTEAAILVKILPEATFSCIPLAASFLRERIHSENLYENHLSRFFWSLWCSFASNTADFEISIFNLTHKVTPNMSFEIRKSLKRCHLAYTEVDQTKYRVPSMFAFGCIIWTLLHVNTCIYYGRLKSDNKIIGNENGIPLRWDTHIYWLQFNWSAAYALCVLKLRYNQNYPFLVQSQISDFQEPCIF